MQFALCASGCAVSRDVEAVSDLIDGLFLHATEALERRFPEHLRRVVFVVHFASDLAHQV